jgi:biopolymer transport protein ExbD
MTPMVDVVFLLIIFFLTTSSLTQLTRTPLDLPVLPGTSAPGDLSRTRFIINVASDGRMDIDQLPAAREQILRILDQEIARLEGHSEQLDVTVRADRRASLQHINELVEALMERDIRAWRLATLAAGS